MSGATVPVQETLWLDRREILATMTSNDSGVGTLSFGTTTWGIAKRQDRDRKRGIKGHTLDAAFTKIYEVVANRVKRKASMKGIPDCDREDLAHDVMIDLIGRLRKSSGEGKATSGGEVLSYLTNIINGKCADYWRRRKGRGPIPRIHTSLDTELPDSSGLEGIRQVEWNELLRGVRGAWARVSAAHQGDGESLKIFEAVFFNEDDIQSVAQRFNKKPGAVRKNCLVMREKLKAELIKSCLRTPSKNKQAPVRLKRVQVRNPELEGVLGEGGFATVYARQWKGIEVAVKAIKPEVDAARFRRELDTLLQLTRFGHRFIIPVLDHGLNETPPWFAMPKAPLTLKTLLTSEKGADVGARFYVLLRVYFQVLEAIEFAHQQGVVHRDLKPANILLFPDLHGYTARVADFGICLRQYDPAQITKMGGPLGTQGYQAPEQERDPHSCGPTADIYALGKILEDILLHPHHQRAFLTRRTREIINRCMQHDLENRYPDIDSLREDLWPGLAALVGKPPKLDPAYRRFLVQEMGLYWLSPQSDRQDAAELIRQLKSEQKRQKMSFLEDLPTLHPRDIKYLILHQPSEFGQLLDEFFKTVPQSLKGMRADQRAIFYRRLAHQAYEAYHGTPNHPMGKAFIETISGLLEDLARTSERRNVERMSRELKDRLSGANPQTENNAFLS